MPWLAENGVRKNRLRRSPRPLLLCGRGPRFSHIHDFAGPRQAERGGWRSRLGVPATGVAGLLSRSYQTAGDSTQESTSHRHKAV